MPRPKPTNVVEARTAQPGDRVCGACGEPNDPARKFCRRCGNPLAEARIVEARIPWWKRLFSRKPKAYAAGQRKSSFAPGAAATSGKAGVGKMIGLAKAAVGVLMALGIVGYVGIPSFQKVVNDATGGGPKVLVATLKRMVAPTFEVVRPTNVSGPETAGFEAKKIFDGFSNTDWRAEGAGQRVSVTFKEPVDLGAMIVYAGTKKAFTEFRRPASLRLIGDDGQEQVVQLQDIAEQQRLDIELNDVTTLVIEIVETNGPGGAPVTISEIEFFAKR